MVFYVAQILKLCEAILCFHLFIYFILDYVHRIDLTVGKTSLTKGRKQQQQDAMLCSNK